MITNGARRAGLTVAMAGALALSVTGCGAGGAGETATDGAIPVVASTDAWGSVLRAVGGDQASVTSVIDASDGDPHSYESTARDGLTFTDAELVLYNGGGYDTFAGQLAGEASDDTPVLDAVELSGHNGGNEHVWYDLDAVETVANAAADALGKIRPAEAETFDRNAKRFAAGLDDLRRQLASIRHDSSGAKVLATEPIAHYLIESAGLDDVTPVDFRDAIENETDVPVATQATVLRLVRSGSLAAVVSNPQTATPVTQQVIEAARNEGVDIVDVTETLPGGESSYLTWVGGQVDALSAAVSR